MRPFLAYFLLQSILPIPHKFAATGYLQSSIDFFLLDLTIIDDVLPDCPEKHGGFLADHADLPTEGVKVVVSYVSVVEENLTGMGWVEAHEKRDEGWFATSWLPNHANFVTDLHF